MDKHKKYKYLLNKRFKKENNYSFVKSHVNIVLVEHRYVNPRLVRMSAINENVHALQRSGEMHKIVRANIRIKTTTDNNSNNVKVDELSRNLLAKITTLVK